LAWSNGEIDFVQRKQKTKRKLRRGRVPKARSRE
jgi:hypothetical protein